MNRRRRATALALAIITLITQACSDDAPAANIPDPEPTSAQATEACGADSETTATQEDLMNVQPLESADLSQADQDAIELYRNLAAYLTTPNPATCRGMEQVDAVVAPEAIGAFETFSFEHDDPAVSYHLALYPNRGLLDELGGRSALPAALAGAGLEAPAEVYAVGGLIVAVYGDESSPDASEEVIDFYNRYLQGTE